MSHDEHAHPNPNAHDDPSAVPVLDVAGVSIVVFIATVIVVAALYFQVETDTVAARDESLSIAKQTARAQDDELLRFGWVDKARGVARIRIGDAMKVVARDLAAGGTGLPPVPTTMPAETPASDHGAMN